MSGPIQSPAPGYLSLLALKNTGLLPPEVIDRVQPTLDLGPTYLRGQMQRWTDAASGNLAVTAFNNFGGYAVGPIVVPQNQTWFVHWYTVRATSAAAGGTLSAFAPAWSVGVAPWSMVGSSASYDVTSQACSAFARDFWLPPGASLGVYLGTTAAQACNYDLAGLFYTPLLI